MKLFQNIAVALVVIFSVSRIFAQDGAEPVQRRCKLIQKAFVSKGGMETGQMEYYLSCKNGDAFIKVCKGKVGVTNLDSLVGRMVIANISVYEGDWDICDSNELAQSRIGPYVVLYSIEAADVISEADKINEDTHIRGENADSLAAQVLKLIRNIEQVDSIEFAGYFMPLSEYRSMSVDTTISSGIRQGMGAITEEQFKYRYLLVYQRFTRSIAENNFKAEKAVSRGVIVNKSMEGGIEGMEGVLELSAGGKDYYLKLLAIYRNNTWNLVELDRIMSEKRK